MDAELDDDGDIKLELDGSRCLASVSPEQNGCGSERDAALGRVPCSP